MIIYHNMFKRVLLAERRNSCWVTDGHEGKAESLSAAERGQ